ncbi:tetratricopeptide repeat protein [Spirulina major]|uniref:tetratricopeptide repeat protein n=1 Tax=Spirulina major TaxID=270636 RepID=UPI0009336D4B|nr:tetratricopeptide repeat protein [Spirulina major]
MKPTRFFVTILALGVLGSSGVALAQDTDYEVLAEQCRTVPGEEGLAACDQAIALEDGDPALWLNRGVKYDRDLNQRNEAIASYLSAIERDPDNDYSLAWYNTCAVLLKFANIPNSIDPDVLVPILIDLEVIEAETENPGPLATSSSTLYEAVVESCDRALTGDENWGTATPARAWNNLGYAQDELGDYEAALAAYDNAIADDPSHVGAFNNKGITLENLDRHADALAAYEAALDLDPNYDLARRNRARLLQQHPELQLETPDAQAETSPAE